MKISEIRKKVEAWHNHKGKNPFYIGKRFIQSRFQEYINSRPSNIKSIKIIIHRKDNRFIEVPLTKYEIFQLSDLCYFLDEDSCELNQVNLNEFWRKMEFIEHDILNEGTTYGTNPKTKKLEEDKKPHYLIKKPIWKKG